MIQTDEKHVMPSIDWKPENCTDYHQRRKILVALDGSPASLEALDFACNRVIRDKDVLILATVLDYNSIEECWYQDQIKQTDVLPRKIFSIAERLKSDCLQKWGDIPIHIIVRIGDVRDVLVELAEMDSVVAVVMGSRGLGILKQMFLGSVSNYVVNHSNKSVVIVK